MKGEGGFLSENYIFQILKTILEIQKSKKKMPQTINNNVPKRNRIRHILRKVKLKILD